MKNAIFEKKITVLATYQTAFLSHLTEECPNQSPENLYAPVNYILQLGGKRIRPVLALMACDAVAEDFSKALPAALAIEVFHNFSLVHDDIMDEAPVRRGKPTVHEKWDSNAGILSGDVMLVWAYECLNGYPAELFKPLTKLFSKTAREVCEGQQMDIDFPLQKTVSQIEYLEMIRLKTAVLLGCSLQMGAMIGGLSEKDSAPFYQFGIDLGLAFQLQDDYLDAFGDPKTFGKQVGGDIIENKKTLLYLLALEQASPEDKDVLENWFTQSPKDPTTKIAEVKALFQKTKADKSIQTLIKAYTDKALSHLDDFALTDPKKEGFRSFALQLMSRNL